VWLVIIGGMGLRIFCFRAGRGGLWVVQCTGRYVFIPYPLSEVREILDGGGRSRWRWAESVGVAYEVSEAQRYSTLGR
jgi:hypothetical protein